MGTSLSAEESRLAIEAGARVLNKEADAMRLLAEQLGDAFAQAVNLMSTVKGRVVVTGMGKSGHVGCKIAATLASTGTPAFFVHPAEAGHGDLGMVTRDDVVLALSNSGNTAELAPLLAYVKRFRIPMIGVTSRLDSLLAEQSDIVLLLPAVPEACPLGLAPTTSTTLMLALGDALAVARLEREGFSASDFRIYHPGGSLGQRLVRIADLMHKGDEIPLAPQTISMADALLLMTAKSFGCVGLTDDAGHLVGIITDGDLRRNMASNLLEKSAQSVMTKTPRVIKPSALAAEALALMNLDDHPVTSLFVVEDGRPVGIVHIHDCLRVGAA